MHQNCVWKNGSEGFTEKTLVELWEKPPFLSDVSDVQYHKGLDRWRGESC